ncbi:hypothetical protein U9M48_033529 [Paspalum notatum var. saurae]|uniref:Uncharacterized protein n=1 Tax=Paspalum notatum var. saurae TaxID=547442 RepID=A0AAQ3X6P2_PASNO
MTCLMASARVLAVLLPGAHEDAGLEVLAHQLRIPRLVAVHGPRKDGLPVAQALHRQVPAAVAHERRRGSVRQDLQPRRPPGDQQPPPFGLLGELAQQLLVPALALVPAREFVRAVGVAHHADEPLVAVAQCCCALSDLLLERRATEGDAVLAPNPGVPLVSGEVLAGGGRGDPRIRQPMYIFYSTRLI